MESKDSFFIFVLYRNLHAMKYLLKLSIPAFMLLFCIACSSPAPSQNANSKLLAPDEFEQAVLNTPEVQLIDVRTPLEVQAGKIPGAKMIDFRSADFKAQLTELDPKRPIMVYCAKGGRSGKAAKILQELGFENISDLDGGMTRWLQEGKEVEMP